jgi:predicted transposase YbfD/YdcC
MTIREYIYQSNVDWADNLLHIIEELKEKHNEDLTKEDLLGVILKFNSEIVQIKKGITKEIIALIDRIDVNLLNHKVPKSKLKL